MIVQILMSWHSTEGKFAREAMRTRGVNQQATRAHMRNAKVNAKTESHSHTDCFIVES